MNGSGVDGREVETASAAEVEAGAVAFARATGLFQALVGDLSDRKADAMTVFKLEVMVGERGREVMLELLLITQSRRGVVRCVLRFFGSPGC